MKILSIYPYTHISSAALLINGKIVSGSQEERFNRKKMSTDFPLSSINWCLNSNNLKFKDLDYIVIPWNPQKNINHVSMRWVKELRWRGEMLTNVPATLMRLINERSSEKISMSWGKNKLVFLDHHLCHSAFGYYQSGFKDSAILTVDGHGENETCFFGEANNGKIKKLDSINYPNSVGLFYGTFTDFLGFKPDSDEWKVMALSAHDKKNIYDKKIQKIYKFYNGKFEIDLSYFDYYTFDRKKNFFSKKFADLFGLPRKHKDPITLKHKQIASAMQRHFEKIIIKLLKYLKKKSKSKNLILGGGAAMNCVFNGRLDKIKFFKDSHISYAPDDSGVAVGAALLAYHSFKKIKYIPKQIKHCYFGPEFSNNEIKNILIQNKINFTYEKNIEKYTAKKLSEGSLIGWFQGKMEYGHRALGNRSIIADPRNKRVKDIVNKAIKFRENFRPFAPAILKDYQHEIMDMPKNRDVYFMERAYKFRNSWRKKIPGVVHHDFTGRIQTVDKKNNLRFYNLIKFFKDFTGIPVLLNTSFNLNGEPIVMSPTDAIKTFYSCGLDILVIGNYVIKKN
tara:strand:- start:3991 stop:5685 length:1695 start_codon:yes stop_codon:yes gene_type:complete